MDCARNDKPLVVSGGDDCQIKVWDTRRRQAVTTLNNNYQVTAVQFTEDPTQIVTAGIDNDIKIWDTRKNAMVTEIQVCHGAILSSDSATEELCVCLWQS